MGRYLLIVGQDQPELRDYFTRWFSEVPEVEVISDRRRGERRHNHQPQEPERRRGERRSNSSISEEIRQTGFAIVGTPVG